MSQNEMSATVLSLTYNHCGTKVTVLAKDPQVEAIGASQFPGMARVVYVGGIIEDVVSDQMVIRAKVDDTPAIIMPDKGIELAS